MGKLFWTFINKINAVRNLKSPIKKIEKSKTEKLMAVVACGASELLKKNSSETSGPPLFYEVEWVAHSSLYFVI